MSPPLRVLFVEDSEDDLTLLLREMKKSGIELDYLCVDTEQSMQEALQNRKWDLIISDYVLPQFSGTKALEIIQKSGLDIPFLIVSGAIGEDLAVEAMKAGAHDYILKNNLKRLIPAVKREIKEATNRRHKKEIEAQLLHSSFYDTLTDLPNRALFMDRLQQAINRAKRRPDHLFAVIFVDIDRFKIINESLGHECGDKLLIHFSKRLETCVRPGDTVAHFGGDEFVILLDDINDISEATRVVERIKEELQTPFTLKNNEIFINVSVGITSSATRYDRPEDVLRDADTATHRAKISANGRCEVFDQAMHASTMALLKLENDLRRALEREEFLVYFQPIISLTHYEIMCFEALIRWRHNDTLFYPTEFIPLAEETGLIVPIERWVLRETCLHLKRWQEKFPDRHFSASVNISGKQFSQPDLPLFVDSLLKQTDLEPRHLILEVTESAIIQNPASGKNMLCKLKDVGIQLYIDDFGTGYSSLSYLLQYPIDFVKIDRSFIHKINLDKKNTEIVQAIVTLSKNLGMGIIAEGIETASQLQKLQGIHCDFGQGFLFARPMKPEDLEIFIASGNCFTPPD
jgi:diguanylate cyclase (GGDEF)-like protein